MIVIGVTGSIGMGKTSIAQQFEYLRYPSHNSDRAVHNALQPNGAAFEEVAVTFPQAWDKKNHIIKKDVLGALIFSDADKKRQLENILHPIVRYSQIVFMRRQKQLGCKICVLDVPLLFETGGQNRVDYTVVASAPFFIQRRRVLKRKGMTEEKFSAILETQMPDREKRARADFVVQTGLGKAFSMRQVKQILKEIANA